jgi:hypothetical protein
MRLTINMRLLAQAAHMSPQELQHTQRFASWLLNIGNGSINNENNEVILPPSTLLFKLYSYFFYQISIFHHQINRWMI